MRDGVSAALLPPPVALPGLTPGRALASLMSGGALDDALLLAAFAEAPIGMAVADLDGEWLQANRAMGEMLGRDADDLTGHTVSDFSHPDDLELDVLQARDLAVGRIGAYQVQRRCFTAGGQLVWTLQSSALVRDGDGVPQHVIIQLQDVTERRELEERLRHRADHDALTGVWNRARFEEELDRQLARCERYGETAALLLFDLDTFKEINDSHGHQAGDELIIAIARAVRSRLRVTDVLARLGGDEFAVLAVGADREQALEIAKAVGAAVREVRVRELSCTSSIGAAMLHPGQSARDALEIADRAMYRAKAEGGDGAVLDADGTPLQPHEITGRFRRGRG